MTADDFVDLVESLNTYAEEEQTQGERWMFSYITDGYCHIINCGDVEVFNSEEFDGNLTGVDAANEVVLEILQRLKDMQEVIADFINAVRKAVE